MVVAKKKKRSRSPLSSLLIDEHGTIVKEAGVQVALGYPAPYQVGASSLGAQTVYRGLNRIRGLGCSRFFMPERDNPNRTLVTLENGRPVSQAHALAFSISCETELIHLVELLKRAGLDPLAANRHAAQPPVVVGGPLTLLDPRLVAPLCDIVVVGEGEQALPRLGVALVNTDEKDSLLNELATGSPGIWIPSCQDLPPSPQEAPFELLPASAATWSPRAGLKDLFLVEAARGCKRGCAFCLLSHRVDGALKFRPFAVEKILDTIPEDAPGVGLVGAAVTDHPEIERLVGRIVETGRRVSLSSIRADRLTSDLARLLKKGGLRTLTLAADGASDRLRKSIHKGITSDDLKKAAEIAASFNIRGIKLYAMVGLPDEQDADVKELAELALTLSRKLRIALSVQAFVPKPGTPLASAQMMPVNEIRHRMDVLKRGVRGRVRIMPTSPRWSFIDWKLAHAGEHAAHAAIAAHERGGSFSAWRRAIEDLGI